MTPRDFLIAGCVVDDGSFKFGDHCIITGAGIALKLNLKVLGHKPAPKIGAKLADGVKRVVNGTVEYSS